LVRLIDERFPLPAHFFQNFPLLLMSGGKLLNRSRHPAAGSLKKRFRGISHMI
jgi:hypothetical protein